jgi:hypothetical protein
LRIVASTVGTLLMLSTLEQAYQQALKNDPQWAAINNQYWLIEKVESKSWCTANRWLICCG